MDIGAGRWPLGARSDDDCDGNFDENLSPGPSAFPICLSSAPEPGEEKVTYRAASVSVRKSASGGRAKGSEEELWQS